MTEPQVWTLIGVFGAAFFGMLTIVSTLFVRVVRAEIGGLRNEMNAKFDGINTRFESMNTRLDGLDRDVQALMRREFGIDRD